MEVYTRFFTHIFQGSFHRLHTLPGFCFRACANDFFLMAYRGHQQNVECLYVIKIEGIINVLARLAHQVSVFIHYRLSLALKIR